MNKNEPKFHVLLNLTATKFNMPRVFDPGKAGWKMDANGHIELKDGNPIWLDANGGEAVLAGDTIARLNGEARDLRKRAETAETALTPFKGIDPEAAKKAIDLVKNIDAKKLIDAGEVDKVRAEISGQFTAQLTEKDKAIADLNDNLNGLRIDNIFNQSPFIRENIAVPPDMFQATFRKNFKIGADGKPEAYGRDGNRIMSKKNIGEYADPDEAIALMVDQHPQKDTILKAPGHSGTNNNGGGGGRANQRVVKRVDFDKMVPSEQANLAAKAATGEVSIVD